MVLRSNGHLFVHGICHSPYQFRSNTTSTRTVDGNGQRVLGNPTLNNEGAIGSIKAEVFTKEHIHQTQQAGHVVVDFRDSPQSVAQTVKLSLHSSSGGFVQILFVYAATPLVRSHSQTIKEHTAFAYVLNEGTFKGTGDERKHGHDWAVSHAVSFDVHGSFEVSLGSISHVVVAGIVNDSLQSQVIEVHLSLGKAFHDGSHSAV